MKNNLATGAGAGLRKISPRASLASDKDLESQDGTPLEPGSEFSLPNLADRQQKVHGTKKSSVVVVNINNQLLNEIDSNNSNSQPDLQKAQNIAGGKINFRDPRGSNPRVITKVRGERGINQLYLQPSGVLSNPNQGNKLSM